MSEPSPEAVQQADGSFVLTNSDGSTLRWTQRPNGDWRKPEHKRAGWSSGISSREAATGPAVGANSARGLQEGAVAGRCLPRQPRPRLGGAAGALLHAAGALHNRTRPAPRTGAVREAVGAGRNALVSKVRQEIPAQQEPRALTAAEPVVVPEPAVTAAQARVATVADAATAATEPASPPKEALRKRLLIVEEWVASASTESAEASPNPVAATEVIATCGGEEPLETSEPVAVSESMVMPEPPVLHADFLEFCLGGPAAVLEAEIEQAAEEDGGDKEPSLGNDCASGGECFMFSMDMNAEDPDSEADDDGDDLEDMFDFDPTRVAELMNKGAQVEEITEHLQTAYADALERRLGMHADEEQAGETATENENCCDDAERPQLEMGDLDALMTPEFVTPITTPKGSAEKPAGECVAARARASLDDTCRSTQDRSRRSIAVQQRPSAAHRGSAAIKAMEAFGRRSIAQAQGEDKALLESAVQDAVRRASVRHRRSVTKAVEVLEEAADALDVPFDKMSEEQMDSKVELIQEAMDEAYRRHRRNITDAVGDAVARGGTETCNAEAGPDVAVEDRIRFAVAEAYERQCAAFYQGYDEASYQGYGGASNYQGSAADYQGYDNATYYQGDSSAEYYPGYSEQWLSETSGPQAYNKGTCASWGMQPQAHSQGWQAETADQNWSQQSAGYGPCTKLTSWDARSNGLHSAHYSWGSG